MITVILMIQHSGHQGMSPPPHLKKFTPLFLANPPQNTKLFNPPPPPFAPTPFFMRKVLVSPPFFTISCFMKPIIRYHEIIVFHQDLTATGSSNKKMLVFFHFTI